MKTARWLVPALACLLLALTDATAAAPSSLVVVNMKAEDAEDHRGSVTFLDPDTHEPLATVETGLWPRWAAFGPERRYIYVLNSGKGGFSAPSKLGTEGTLTVIDSETQTVVASVSLDPFPRKALFSPDGRRLFVICNGTKTTPPSVTAIDLTTHEPAGKAFLGEYMAMWHDPLNLLGDQAHLKQNLRAVTSPGLLFVLRYPMSAGFDKPSEILVVDTTKMIVVARHAPLPSLGSWLSISTDGERVYALCNGHRKLKKATKEDALGKLYVLDAGTGEITSTWGAGFSPKLLGIQPRHDRIFFSTGAAGESPDQLIVLERGKVRTIETLGGRPRQLLDRPGHSEILLSTPEWIVGVDTERWMAVRAFRLPFDVRQIRVGPDGDRVYVAASDDGRFSYVDMPTEKWAQPLKSGRKGVKFGKGLASAASIALAAMVVVVSGSADAGEPETWLPFGGIEWFIDFAEGNAAVLPVYTGPRASPVLDLSQDGQRLLVLNQRTNDVTVVDTKEWRILEKFGTGGGSRAILPSLNGRHHYVLASDRLTVVEFEETANVSRHEIRNPKRGTPTLYVLPRRNEMWLPRKKGMDVFALDTGKFEKSVDDLPRPLMVLSATD